METAAKRHTLQEVEATVALCRYQGYDFHVRVDGRGAWYLQASYWEPDVVTGEHEKQLTRRWFLSPEMTKSEVVQTVFKCVLTSMEHRAREWFLYRDRAVFGPHFDVDALHAICDDRHEDKRPPPIQGCHDY